MIFKLEAEELYAAELFIEEQMKKDNSLPAAGERFAYTFIPCGLGTMVYVKDLHLNEEKEITYYGWWN